MSAASSPKGEAETSERLIMSNEQLAIELLTTSQCMTHGKADAHRLLRKLRADWRAEDGDMLDVVRLSRSEVSAEPAALVPGVTEYGTAFRATEQGPVEVHSPTASRDEAAARADRYRDMYPVVHLVQRTVHYGEWTEAASTEAAERAAVDRSITDKFPATAADKWNSQHPVGTPVFAYPGCRPEDDPKCTRLVTRTRSAASVLGGHTAVVWVEGHSSCISLTHVDPRPETGGAS